MSNMSQSSSTYFNYEGLPRPIEQHQVVFSDTSEDDLINSKYIKEMKGKKNRCEQCFRGKKGKCLVDTRKPYSACLRCIEKNREDECSLTQMSETSSDPVTTQRLMEMELRMERVESLCHPSSHIPPFHAGSDVASADNPLKPGPTSDPPIAAAPLNFEGSSLEPQTDPEGVSKPLMDIVFDTLSKSMSAESIRPIADFLELYFIFTAITITNLGVWVAHTFQSNTPWPVIQWEEGPHTKVVALFKVETGKAIYSSLLYRSIDSGRRGVESTWISVLSWNLIAIDDLCGLLGAASEVFEMFMYLDPEKTTFLFESKQTICSEDQLFICAQRLFPVLYRVKQLQEDFEKSKFWLEKLSYRTIEFDKDGNEYNLLRATVQW